MIKGSILKEFITGDIGLNCKGRTPRACIKKEIDHLQEQAKRSSQIAQFRLAMIYYHHEGVEQNLSSAFEWFSAGSGARLYAGSTDLGSIVTGKKLPWGRGC